MTDTPPPTPPVVDSGALHSDWTGPERRRSDPIVAAITHAVKQAPQARQPDGVWPFVRDAGLVAINLLILILLFKLSGDIHHDRTEQEKFRDGISCFLVDSVQTPPTTDLTDRQRAATNMLVRCGFIETPGNGG
jgi:hypothetical protein